MIVTNFRSASTTEDGKRYVGKSAKGGYRWCVQNKNKREFDTAQGSCDAEDLPKDVLDKCDSYDGVHYACEWPI